MPAFQFLADMLTLQHEHDWDVTPAEAKAIQIRLRDFVVAEDDFDQINTVAGVDAGFEEDERTTTRAAVVVLRYPELDVVESQLIREPTLFPYVSGLLSFREMPALLTALNQLSTLPDLIICDGHGLAHKRRFGLACHLGVVTGIPTIGVGKTRFVGEHDPVGATRGSWQPLNFGGDVVGAVVRTQTNVKPVYVSVGHRVGLATAIEIVLNCAPKYRLPETTRQADHLASHSLTTL